MLNSDDSGTMLGPAIRMYFNADNIVWPVAWILCNNMYHILPIRLNVGYLAAVVGVQASVKHRSYFRSAKELSNLYSNAKPQNKGLNTM